MQSEAVQFLCLVSLFTSPTLHKATSHGQDAFASDKALYFGSTFGARHSISTAAREQLAGAPLFCRSVSHTCSSHWDSPASRIG